MSAEVNKIKLFFDRLLGLKLSITKASKLKQTTNYLISQVWSGDIYSERVEHLLKYYFNDVTAITEDNFAVKLDTFNQDGHGITGICKKCGCTDDDACSDSNGDSCWWITDDLCSACATADEITAAREDNANAYAEYASRKGMQS